MKFHHLVALVLLACAQADADLQIEWSTLDGGGGRSSSGDYILAGSIGQSEAGTLGAGEIALAGGFWLADVPEPCVADINLDGTVDVSDLNIVILCWHTDGTCIPGINADIAGSLPDEPPDGWVNVSDLIAIIVSWGTCP